MSDLARPHRKEEVDWAKKKKKKKKHMEEWILFLSLAFQREKNSLKLSSLPSALNLHTRKSLLLRFFALLLLLLTRFCVARSSGHVWRCSFSANIAVLIDIFVLSYNKQFLFDICLVSILLYINKFVRS